MKKLIFSLFMLILVLFLPVCRSIFGEEIRIRVLQKDPTTQFAAEELARYLELMSGKKGIADIEPFGEQKKFSGPILQLGLFSDFQIQVDGQGNSELNDAVYVKADHSQGIIAGPNPRSILFAVYRFLEANGCRWIRPTADGDYVPHRSIKDLSANISDRAYYKWRGNSNCGTFTIDDVVARIAWSPKVGLNVFLLEFMLPRRQYVNYSSRPYPSLGEPRNLSDIEIQAYHDLSIKEIKKRGLILHGVGHGWTTLVAGCSENESDHNARPTPDPDKVQYLALNKGERSLKNGPTFTDICHGNPEAQKRFARCVADYAQKHPEIDYLHVWLDDRPNNTCECEKCTDQIIADPYVRLLNRIDEELTRRGDKTKIVFIVYHETLWKPLHERFKNTDRFEMMFAPISRNYTESYPLEIPKDADMSPYEKNKCKLPKDVALNIALYQDWKTIFPRNAFVYEYHLTWHHYRDLGYYNFVKIMVEDIRRMKKAGLDGMVSCSVGRAAFPTAFPFWMYARYHWDPNRDFDKLAKEYFQAAFGSDGEKARNYLIALSNDSVYDFTFKTDQDKKEGIRKLKDAENQFRKFLPEIEKHKSMEPSVIRDSWKYLDLHARVYFKWCEWRIVQAEKKPGAIQKQAKQDLVDIIAQTEEETHPVFDLYWFYSRMGNIKTYKPSAAAKKTGTP
ncbi:MAG: DUF4838 domain-containing protein [Planctomycetia bacterium]|nr:DUF4838 domain-containing protein [Planctomycetia bacterium]